MKPPFCLTLALLFALLGMKGHTHAEPSARSIQHHDAVQWNLYDAVRAGRILPAQRLLDSGADVGFFYRDGETLLMCASIRGNARMIDLLLAHGAPVNQVDSFGFTALTLAALNDHGSLIKTLLRHGASANAVNRSEPPLVVMADANNLAMMKVVLNAGRT